LGAEITKHIAEIAKLSREITEDVQNIAVFEGDIKAAAKVPIFQISRLGRRKKKRSGVKR